MRALIAWASGDTCSGVCLLVECAKGFVTCALVSGFFYCHKLVSVCFCAWTWFRLQLHQFGMKFKLVVQWSCSQVVIYCFWEALMTDFRVFQNLFWRQEGHADYFGSTLWNSLYASVAGSKPLLGAESNYDWFYLFFGTSLGSKTMHFALYIRRNQP